jgi:hypothetical protein
MCNNWINPSYACTTDQVQGWLIQIGVSDFDFLQARDKCRRTLEEAGTNPFPRLQLDIEALMNVLITADN